MGRFEYLIEKQRRERRLRRIAAQYAPLPASVAASEWRPAPLGRMGRLLWTDIDRYLQFMEIARSDSPPAEPTSSRVGRPVWSTYSMFD